MFFFCYFYQRNKCHRDILKVYLHSVKKKWPRNKVKGHLKKSFSAYSFYMDLRERPVPIFFNIRRKKKKEDLPKNRMRRDNTCLNLPQILINTPVVTVAQPPRRSKPSFQAFFPDHLVSFSFLSSDDWSLCPSLTGIEEAAAASFIFELKIPLVSDPTSESLFVPFLPKSESFWLAVLYGRPVWAICT